MSKIDGSTTASNNDTYNNKAEKESDFEIDAP